MPTLVQSVSATGTTNASLTITLSATTAGNCLIVGVGGSQGTTNPTVSGITLGGSAGNFASAKSLNNNAETDSEIWADPNCAGGQTSVVVSFNTGTGTNAALGVWVTEWSGIVLSSPVDQTNGASASGASTFSSGATGTLAQASELVIGNVFADGASEAITGPGAPWTNLAQLSPTANAAMVTSYQVVTSTAAQTYSGTLSPSNSLYTAVIATFKAAAVPSGAVQPRATVPVPRRRLARAFVQSIIGRGPPAPPNKQPPLIPRPRPLRRAFVRSIIGLPPPATPNREQQHRPRARPPQRAVVRSVTGTAPPVVKVARAQQPSPVVRRPARAVVLSVHPRPVVAAAVVPGGFQDRRPGYLKKRILLGG